MTRTGLLLLTLAIAACGAPSPQAQGGTSDTGQQQVTLVEQRLLASARIALPPEGIPAESLPEPGSRGAQLMVGFCTQCHALATPAMHAAQDWPSVARRMWARIDMMHGELGVAIPSEGDRSQLLEYLLRNALPVSEALPPGRGRETFSTLCSRCHLLPDPRAHSSADWPAVVVRMERNMERMRVRGLTHEQTQEILAYLQVASRR